jgi:aspartate/methionine/tyrosine aminotransferase
MGPADAISAATNIQSHETSNVSNVAQRAALAAVSGGLEDVAMMREAFDRRRLAIVHMLNDIDGVVCAEPEGAFYAFPSVKGLLGRSLRGRRPASSAELAEICITEAKVAVVPGEAFGAPGYFRMSYALADHDLSEGVSRLAALFAEAQD